MMDVITITMLIIASFSGDIGVNDLGGAITVWTSEGSSVTVDQVVDTVGVPDNLFPPDRLTPECLAIDATIMAEGEGGVRLTLHSADEGPLMAVDYSHLLLLVRGEVGGESLMIMMRDATMMGPGEAIPLGPVESFLRGGRIETNWGLARIALTEFDMIDLSQLESVELVFNTPGAERVYVDEIALTGIPAAQLDVVEPPTEPQEPVEIRRPNP
ncbi:hypothetical protein JXA47_16590 [Candidatus Sumerlaeota bacterium]|nr:hypothetical protein [Candidatus Sumerlaeota bacterium]